MNTFTCIDCQHTLPAHPSGGTGYAFSGETERVCYACVAKRDAQTMSQDGHSNRLPLYLSKQDGRWTVTNWPGTLRFPVLHCTTGHHNIARTQTTVRFVAPDGHWWSGRQYGDNTTIVHCRRTKQRWDTT